MVAFNIGSNFRQARAVVYLALDLLEGQHLSQLAATVQRAFDLAGGEAPGLLLLNEVTAVAGWQTAVKSLWDIGTIREQVVVCTGSSAIDLQHGAVERLPGRRQAGTDHLALPQSFGAFARAVNSDVPVSPRLTIGELCGREGELLMRDMRAYAPALDSLSSATCGSAGYRPR